MKYDDLSPCAQKHATGPYFELYQSSPRPLILFIEDNFNINLLSTLLCSKCPILLRCSRLPCMRLPSAP